ncbi:MAG: hypothetical protein A2152_04100 [Candidatus Levybacteria bacterium RBG_16_35_6]|nr:MAG: hypothetical protein A2152_04100 [Candidatus Levybacteria bacterium RBG_16_35_6]
MEKGPILRESIVAVKPSVNFVHQELKVISCADELAGLEDGVPMSIIDSEDVRQRALGMMALYGLSNSAIYYTPTINEKSVLMEVKVCECDGLEAITVDTYYKNGDRVLSEPYSKYTAIIGFDKKANEPVKIRAREYLDRGINNFTEVFLEIGNKESYAGSFPLEKQQSAADLLGKPTT